MYLSATYLNNVSVDAASAYVEFCAEPGGCAGGDSDLMRLLNNVRFSGALANGNEWVETRPGVVRLRLFGKTASALAPQRRFVSIDLEDFQ